MEKNSEIAACLCVALARGCCIPPQGPSPAVGACLFSKQRRQVELRVGESLPRRTHVPLLRATCAGADAVPKLIALPQSVLRFSVSVASGLREPGLGEDVVPFYAHAPQQATPPLSLCYEVATHRGLLEPTRGKPGSAPVAERMLVIESEKPHRWNIFSQSGGSTCFKCLTSGAGRSRRALLSHKRAEHDGGRSI